MPWTRNWTILRYKISQMFASWLFVPLTINLRDVANIENYSSLIKLKRIIAFICHFIDNLKLRKSNTLNKIQVNSSLQPREISITEEILIRDNQQTFENESKFNILKRELNIVSKNNILKCEGILKYAPITPDAKLPILINRNHYLRYLSQIARQTLLLSRTTSTKWTKIAR